MKIESRLLVLLLFVVSLIACKKDQAEIAEFNRNCSCAEEVTADFTMNEEAMGPPLYLQTNTDTIIYNKNVWFSAKENDAQYTWYIGAEILTEKAFYRYFDQDLVGQTLPVTLVVNKSPNTICLPNDDGYDSIVKYLTVSNKSSNDFFDLPNHLFEGVFRFKDSLGNYPILDSFDLDISLLASGDPDNVGFTNRIRITDWWTADSIFYGGATSRFSYRELWTSYGFFYEFIRIYHGPTGKVELEFVEPSPEVNPDGRKSHFLIGRKLN